MAVMIPTWVNGTLTPVEKLDAHRRALRHKAVSVFVMAKSKVLIQRRAQGKYHTPGLWANTCCTHPEWKEDPTHCAVRRLDEELGIQGLYPVHMGQVEYRAKVGGGLVEHEEVEVFIAQTIEALPMSLNPEEVQATRWVDVLDLKEEVERHPERFTPWLRIYLAEHANMIFGNLMAAEA